MLHHYIPLSHMKTAVGRKLSCKIENDRAHFGNHAWRHSLPTSSLKGLSRL